jgi:N utilization substance protein B
MEAETSDFDADKRILVKLFNKEIMSCEDLYDTLEEQSIYWNDDVEYVINMIAKTIKRITPEDSSHLPLMPLYRDEEDEEFASKLLRKSLTTSDELDGLITEHAENWELDRIIFIDRLLLRLAMTEMMEFSQIPTKVTINEYLEISKYYSSQKSNVFINGVLEQMLVRFRKEGRINKQGRGLIGEGEE